MNKVFHVYLARNDSPCEARAMLELPALPYALRDAMDKVRLREGDELLVQIECYHRCGFLSDMLDSSPRLWELNALAEKLAGLDRLQEKCLEGLVRIDTEDGTKKIGLDRLSCLVSSVDAAELIPVSSDEEYGKYCVKHGLIPALKDLPETVQEMLDFDKIGFVRRCLEEGAFLDDGRSYVIKHGEIPALHAEKEFTSSEPDYSVLLMVNALDHNEALPLKLPTALAEIDTALDHRPAVSWECVDCRVPTLGKLLSEAESLDIVCETAAVLETIPEKNLPAYKALLEAEGFYSLGEAMGMLDRLGAYLLSPQYSTPAELAADELGFLLSAHDAETLLPFVDLHAYGNKLIQQQELTLTEYGLIEQKDSQPVQGQKEENKPSQGGMTMGGM